MSYLLDTCSLIWLMSEPDRLSIKARKILGDVKNVIYTSDISAWEIQIKYMRGKLRMKDSPRKIYESLYDDFLLRRLTLKIEAIFILDTLADIHQDPFDRLLISQAIHEGFSILTPDPVIAKYPVKTVW